MTMDILAQDNPITGATEARCTCGWTVYGKDCQNIITLAFAHMAEHRSVEADA